MTSLPQRRLFDLPDGVIYLDGNSLGPLPVAAKARVAEAVSDHWGKMLIRGWNAAGWIDLPSRIGDRIARLIGAEPGSVMACDSTSVNLFKVLSAALSLSGRRVVLSDMGNFPTDLYVAQGLLGAMRSPDDLKIVAPDTVLETIDETVAVVMLTQVDYRTGRLHDMAAITAKAHDAGALVIWDLAHSAGALPVDLQGCRADFAVGCGYKYLNGGPGAPAFLYVRPDHADRIAPALGGWMGHEAPFAFDLDFRPAQGVDRMRVGTPPILSMVALDAALDLWDDQALSAIRAQSIALADLFIAEVERQCSGFGLELATPRDGALRGSQVSFHLPDLDGKDRGYATMQALIAENVIGDFRAPDLLRFGFAPLYNTEDEVREAARRLSVILSERRWDQPRFLTRAKVT
ncbi:MAG: kynureninase [Pseudomonadota bacterium]